MATEVRLRLLIDAIDNTSKTLGGISAKLKEVAGAGSKILPNVPDGGSPGLQSLAGQLQGLVGNFQGAGGASDALMSSLGAMAGKLTVIATAAIVAGVAFKEMGAAIISATLLAAKVETASIVVEQIGKNAGYAAVEMRAFVKEIVQQGITTQVAQGALQKMAQSNLDLAQASALARSAQDVATLSLTNSSDAFDRMIHGIQTGRTEIMRSLGLNVDFEASYEKMAIQLKKSTGALTEQEKTQARMNATMVAAANTAGAYEAAMGTAYKQMKSLDRAAEEAQLNLGKMFTPAFGELIKGVAKLLENVGAYLKAFWEAPQSAPTIAAFKQLGIAILALFNAILSFGGETAGDSAVVTLKLLGEMAAATAVRIKGLADVIWLLLTPIRGLLMLYDLLTGREQQWAAALQGAMNVKMKTTKEMVALTAAEGESYKQSLQTALATLNKFKASMEAMGGSVPPVVAEKIRQIETALKDLTRVDAEKLKQSLDMTQPLQWTDAAVKQTFANLKAALAEAKKDYETYAARVIELEQQIKNAKMSTADQIRALGQKGMDEQAAWDDRKLQAEEKMKQALEVAAAARAATNAKEQELLFKQAEELAKQAQALGASLATEISGKGVDGAKEIQKTLAATIPIAKSVVEEAGKILVTVLEASKTVATDASAKFKTEYDTIKAMLDDLTAKREAKITITQEGLERIRSEMEALTGKTWVIHVRVVKTEGASVGGMVGMARGGKLPGDSKIDSIPVLARPGEWFIRNEAVKQWTKMFGPGFMSGINSPWSKAGGRIQNALARTTPRFAEGGQIASAIKSSMSGVQNQVSTAGPRNLGVVRLNIGNQQFPVLTTAIMASKLKHAVHREMLMRTS